MRLWILVMIMWAGISFWECGRVGFMPYHSQEAEQDLMEDAGTLLDVSSTDDTSSLDDGGGVQETDLVETDEVNDGIEAFMEDAAQTEDSTNPDLPDNDQGVAWLDGYSFRKEIIIPGGNIAGVLEDFPVLIRLETDAELAIRARVDGSDLVFTGSDGLTVLFREIEYFDKTTGELTAWVKVPTLSTVEDNGFYLYYGDPESSHANDSAVWDEHYKAVWHLNQIPGIEAQVLDSTTNSNHGIFAGEMDPTHSVTGHFGPCLNFDGIDDYLDLDNPTSLQVSQGLTLEGWFKSEGINNSTLIDKTGLSGSRGWSLAFDDDGSLVTVWIAFVYSMDGYATYYVSDWRLVGPADGWIHVVGVFSRGNFARFYFNGQLVDENTIDVNQNLYNTPAEVGMGARVDGYSHKFKGRIDEVRISDQARSSEWIATQYFNLSKPDLFLSIAQEQTRIVHGDNLGR